MNDTDWPARLLEFSKDRRRYLLRHNVAQIPVLFMVG